MYNMSNLCRASHSDKAIELEVEVEHLNRFMGTVLNQISSTNQCDPTILLPSSPVPKHNPEVEAMSLAKRQMKRELR